VKKEEKEMEERTKKKMLIMKSRRYII
jgi:hypothetical protein